MSESQVVAFKPKKSVALSGVTAGNTALCTVGKTGNDLHYRGYDILDIATQCEFEEIAYLLVHDKLPNKSELAAYKAKLKSLRSLPKGVLTAAVSADLPPPLRHLRKDAPKTMAAAEAPALKIAFPPDGALIDLGLNEGARDSRLALKALGGAPPFTWFVNGQPVGEADLRRQSAWKPDGAGFARVSVTDAKGASDAVVVRLE